VRHRPSIGNRAGRREAGSEGTARGRGARRKAGGEGAARGKGAQEARREEGCGGNRPGPRPGCGRGHRGAGRDLRFRTQLGLGIVPVAMAGTGYAITASGVHATYAACAALQAAALLTILSPAFRRARIKQA
jgi:hypothetical protein